MDPGYPDWSRASRESRSLVDAVKTLTAMWCRYFCSLFSDFRAHHSRMLEATWPFPPLPEYVSQAPARGSERERSSDGQRVPARMSDRSSNDQRVPASERERRSDGQYIDTARMSQRERSSDGQYIDIDVERQEAQRQEAQRQEAQRQEAQQRNTLYDQYD